MPLLILIPLFITRHSPSATDCPYGYAGGTISTSTLVRHGRHPVGIGVPKRQEVGVGVAWWQGGGGHGVLEGGALGEYVLPAADDGDADEEGDNEECDRCGVCAFQ